MKSNMKKLKLQVWERDEWICYYCKTYLKDEYDKWQQRKTKRTKSPLSPTVDHKIPRAKGGMNTIENLVTCCKKCNGDKGDKILSVDK